MFRTMMIFLFMCGQAVQIADATAEDEIKNCLPDALPKMSKPKNFSLPKISSVCWRAPRESDGRGIHFKATFDVTPNGDAENINVNYADPNCASSYIETWISTLKYECSKTGRKNMKISMTLNR